MLGKLGAFLTDNLRAMKANMSGVVAAKDTR
jgi:hypothetical protein